MKRTVFVLIILLSLTVVSFAQDSIKFTTEPLQRIDVPFRLFRTDNIWTFLMLDTRNGRVWQICYGVDANSFQGILTINSDFLVQGDEKIGRFTLYPTGNMWNYLLLDQENGRVWQCQFSTKSEYERFIIPLGSVANKNDLSDLGGSRVSKLKPAIFGKGDTVVDQNLIDLGPASITKANDVNHPPAGFTEDVTPKPSLNEMAEKSNPKNRFTDLEPNR